MAQSIQSATVITIEAGTVAQMAFDLSFAGGAAHPPGYLEKTHVALWLNTTRELTLGGGDTNTAEGSGISFTWETDTRVTVSGVDEDGSGQWNVGDVLEFRRTIPKEEIYVNFVDTAGITEAMLDNSALANLYSIHEIQDGYGTGIFSYYALAEAAAEAAEASETAAALSETNAAASEAAASASESAAAASEANAATSETNANISELNAGISETAAETAETNAALSETNAAASESAASTSETNAAASEAAAAISETNADTSETNAAASESAASTSETNAAASEAKAEDWAIQPEDVEVETGKYSALHWAAKAEAAAASGLYKESEHTATAGQTVFTHTADVVNEQISLNGAILAIADYTVSATTQITLSAGATVGDILRIQTIGLIAVNTYLPLSGSDPMTGALTLAGDPTADLHPVTRQYLGALDNTNLLINGNFDIWQRGTSFSSTGYSADRWDSYSLGGATFTITPDVFTLGQTDVPGNPINALKLDVTAGSVVTRGVAQHIEDVRTAAGETVTVSLYAKADTSRTLVLSFSQEFGSGGSSTVNVTEQTFALTTSWQKITAQFAIPSISGKTIGSGSYLQYKARLQSITTGTMYIARTKVEKGSIATEYIDRPIGTELSLCQRYYCKSYGLAIDPGTNSPSNAILIRYLGGTAANQWAPLPFPVRMCSTPTLTLYSLPGTADRVSEVTSGAIHVVNVNIDAIFNLGHRSFAGVDLTTAKQYIGFHYTADAEL